MKIVTKYEHTKTLPPPKFKIQDEVIWKDYLSDLRGAGVISEVKEMNGRYRYRVDFKKPIIAKVRHLWTDGKQLVLN